MKYLKTYKIFESHGYEQLISDIEKTAKENGVKLILPETETVEYNGFECSGYFIDNGNPTLACGIGGDVKVWGPILAHESSHMDQWIEQCPEWKGNYYKGKECVDWLEDWTVDKVKLTEQELDKIIDGAIGVELDCEKRTIEKEKKYNLPVNITEEIQKSISYIWFYRFLKESKKWGKSTYKIKEVWSVMPKSFEEVNFKVVPEHIKEVYYKYCY